MMTTYSYSTGCCLSSTTTTSTSKSGDLVNRMEDGEDSDPLILCFTSTSVVVGRGGKAAPMYAICCTTSVINDLLRPAMQHHKSTPSSNNIPIVDLDPQDGSVSAATPHAKNNIVVTSLLPREVVSLARGESLVVTYPLAWSHMHDGDELELLSSFVFSTLGAATSLFVAAPLAAAYGLGIGLKEGDEGVARGLVQPTPTPSTSTTSVDVENVYTDASPPPPPKSQVTGSKRPRDEVVEDNEGSSTSSDSSSDDESDESDDSSSDEENSTTKKASSNNNNKKAKSSGTSKRRAFGGRLLSVQIDATSMTVSHVAMGSVQRFIKVSLGVKERAAYTIDVRPILSSLEAVLNTIDTLQRKSPSSSSMPLQSSIYTVRQCMHDVSRFSTTATTGGPSLTDLVLASRDLTLYETTNTSVMSLDEIVSGIGLLCGLDVSGEEDEEERVGSVHTACAKLCASARVCLHSLLLKRDEEGGSSCGGVIADLFSRTGAVGNAVGKLEAKLDSDEDYDEHRRPPTSLISLGGEVMEWLRIEAAYQSRKQALPPTAVSALQAIEESVSRSTIATGRRMVLLPSTMDSHIHSNNTTIISPSSSMIEYQGASLVAAIGDRDFLKLSMTAAEYTEKGPSHIRWRCAR